MQKENRNTLLFVPLVGKTSAYRQKEGLKLIKNLPLLPRLTAVLPPQGRESDDGFSWSTNVGQALPDSKGCLTTMFASPLEGEDVRRTKEGVWNKLGCITPLLASGHPLPQGARITARGFTLIEILVVVLIIGILAAVALPQYQLAVLKSRYVQNMVSMRPAYEAWKSFYLANGYYTTQWSDLDLLPTQKTGGRVALNGAYRCTIYVDSTDFFDSIICMYTTSGGKLGYRIFPDGSRNCLVTNTWTLGNKVCTAVGGTYKRSDGGYTTYTL